MSLEYAPLGLVGVLTPQANTTVEPEMALMAPPGLGVLNARLRSDKPTIPERLVEYFDGYDAALAEFANAPLAAVGFACTGASYLAGVEREDAACAAMSARRGVPVVTAATAVTDALRVLGARRIALVSPYFEALDAASEAYWRARGFVVVSRVSAWRETDAFHPIYSLGTLEATAALEGVRGADVDAVVMLGTGMPTLRLIAHSPRLGKAPVLSCMFCLGWRLIAAALGDSPDRTSLTGFLDDPGWRARLRALPG
jgi:maleate cis-trans isomerase